MGSLIYYAVGNRQKEEQIRKLAEMTGLEFRPLSPLQSGQQIGYLAGIKGFSEKKLSVLELPPRIDEEILLFSGIEDGRLDDVLAMLRGSGLSVSLKAIVTPHNVNWTLAALYRELAAERDSFRKK